MAARQDNFADISAVRKTAFFLLTKGLTPLPLPPEDGKPSKKPKIPKWQELTVDPDQINTLFTEGCNIGMRLDNVTDVDLDCPEAIHLSIPFLKQTPGTWGRDTARHSHHLYKIPGSAIHRYKDPMIEEGKQMIVEIRTGNGEQSMIPPSVHPNGEQLHWESMAWHELAPWTYPEVLSAVGRIAAAVLLVRYLKKGNRHDVWFFLAASLKRAEWTQAEAEDFARAVANARQDDVAHYIKAITRTWESEKKELAGLKKISDEDLLPKPVVRCIGQWLNLRKANVKPEDLSDEANASIIGAKYSEDLRYLPNEGKGGLWVYWNDVTWKRDHLGYVHHLAAQTLKERAETLIAASRDTRFTEKAQRELLNVPGINAALAYLEWMPDVAAESTLFDANPWLIGLQNGVYNLQTNQLEPGARDHLVSRQVLASYDPNATCPRWEACLERAQTKADVRQFLQRLAGSCLLGMQTEHGFTFNYGRGANFKTAFSEILRRVMGDDYATTPNEALFFSGNQEVPANFKADIHGMRLLTIGEKKEGSAWNLEFIKQLLGGQEVNACRKFCEAFSFVPTARVIAAANNKPRLNELDEATRRRFLLVLWDVTIPATVDGIDPLSATETDPDVILDHLKHGPRMPFEHLMTLLLEERNGILKWMIDGCRDFVTRGLRLVPPASIQSATDNYFEDEDVAGRFVKDWCETIHVPDNLDDNGVKKLLQEKGTDATVLHEAFTEWSQFGKHAWGKQKVTRRLEKVDGVVCQRCTGNRVRLNLVLTEEATKAVATANSSIFG